MYDNIQDGEKATPLSKRNTIRKRGKKMEGMITFLVGFPFISALLLSIVKQNAVRKIITYVSSGAIIFTPITFALSYFMLGAGEVTFVENATLFGKEVIELVDYAMIAGEIFLVALITVLSIKYKKY